MLGTKTAIALVLTAMLLSGCIGREKPKAATGKNRMKNIEPGTYTITAEKEGYEKAERTINVAAGKETVVNFVLLAGGEHPSGAIFVYEVEEG